MSKIFEKILLARINKHLEENDILRSAQFGFQKVHSTKHMILKLVKNITHQYN